MIDKATGFDKEKMVQAKRIMARVKKLLKEYNQITGESSKGV